jgi:hypothetical protein
MTTQQFKNDGWEDLGGHRFLINVADLKNPATGKTYRQENLEKVHAFPVGTLVEIIDEDDDRTDKGIRLHVIKLCRDCDGTPLYSLGIIGKTQVEESFVYNGFNGYSEDSLRIISPPNNGVNADTKEPRENLDVVFMPSQKNVQNGFDALMAKMPTLADITASKHKKARIQRAQAKRRKHKR